jgi:hypothetical protein
MIEVLEDFPDNVAAFACHGHITAHDYATVLIPAVEKALQHHDKVRIYYETAGDIAGVDSGAVWEDTKVGFRHQLRWERIAVVADVEWMRLTVRAFGFLMPGEMKLFSKSEAQKAREWIIAA